MKKFISIVIAAMLVFTLFACESYDDVKTIVDDELELSTESSAQPDMTVSQQNALRCAKEYLDYTAFSYGGLINQLEFEGFSTEDATFAVDNCGADWNEQAVKCAKSYLDFMAYSFDGLVSQLEYEGFTHEQAVYGAQQNGF